MPPSDPVALGAIVVGAAFLPPLFFTIYIRNVERHQRNSWSSVFGAFIFGAFFSVIVAILLETGFHLGFNREYNLPEGQQSIPFELLLAVIIAPLAEEFAKGLAVRGQRRRILELEDGIIYGAAAGLGFSATENLFYELGTLAKDVDELGAQSIGWGFLVVAALRSVTSSFLHATTSGILGYGMAHRYLGRGMFLEVLPYYALAVLLHGAFNGLAIVVSVNAIPLGGIALIVFVSIAGLRWTITRIRRLDAQGAVVAYR